MATLMPPPERAIKWAKDKGLARFSGARQAGGGAATMRQVKARMKDEVFDSMTD
jgi:hypothetical protein